MVILETVSIVLPNTDNHFQEMFLKYFSVLTQGDKSSLVFNSTREEYLPKIKLRFDNCRIPHVIFSLSSGEMLKIDLVNTTGQSKNSPHKYSSISIEEFILRMEGCEPINLDHAGFDIPWFNGLHPEIISLREKLKTTSLYYLFPTGEYWDFIIPGKPSEVEHVGDPDLKEVRRPKFEIVSLDKTSTPLIQFEFHVKIPYEQLVEMFPEGIRVDEIKCVWVYISNQYGIDVCLVVNEDGGDDWCEYFKNKRLS